MRVPNDKENNTHHINEYFLLVLLFCENAGVSNVGSDNVSFRIGSDNVSFRIGSDNVSFRIGSDNNEWSQMKIV